MNTYGRTECPNCKAENNMYRPIEFCRSFPCWNECFCFSCSYQYNHSDVIDELNKDFKICEQSRNFNRKG